MTRPQDKHRRKLLKRLALLAAGGYDAPTAIMLYPGPARAVPPTGSVNPTHPQYTP